MSRKRDITTKNFLSDPVIFCDLYNGALFGGEQILRPDELKQLNGETALLVQDKQGKKKTENRFRDLVFEAKIGGRIAVLACEVQDKIHFSMPVRGMLYFRTGLREVFEILRFAGEEEKLRSYLQHHTEKFSNLDEDTYDMVFLFLGEKKLAGKDKEKFKTEQGGYNMCTALKELEARGEKTGEKRGMNRLNQLYRILICNDDLELMKLAAQNDSVLNELFLKYGI